MHRRSLLLALASLALPAQAAARLDAHGLLVFGDQDGLYGLSQGRFQAPRDMQLLLRLRIVDAAIDQALRAALAAQPRLWTLLAQPFDLNAVQAGMLLRGRLVAGHYARGGITRWHDVEVKLEQVLLQRVLDPAPPASAELHYLRVGPFLVKEIDARPDFEHIVLLEKAGGPSRLSLARHGLVAPDARSLQAASGARPRATLYYDYADLL